MSRNLIKSIVLIQKTNFSLKKLPFLLFHYNLSSNTIENNENQLIKNKSFRIDRDTIHKKLNMNDSMLKTIPFNTKSNQKRNELDEIKKDIKYGIEDSKYTQVIRAIEKARLLNYQLDIQEYMIGLSACCSISFIEARTGKYIFSQLRKLLDIIPTHAFNHMMKIYTRLNDVEGAISLIQLFEQMYNIPPSKEMLTFLLSILVSSNLEKGDYKVLVKYYKLYSKLQAENKWPIDFELYSKIVVPLSYIPDNGEIVLSILKKLTSHQYEPSALLCSKIIDGSLISNEDVVIPIILNWFIDNFTNQLSSGVLFKLIQQAVELNNLSTLRLLVLLFEKYQMFNDLPLLYNCIIQISLSTYQPLSNIVNVLIEIENKRIHLYEYHTSINTLSIGETIRNSIVKYLVKKQRLQEELYYILVELVRKDIIIPCLALDSYLLASGLSGKQDRAFSTFNEYSTLFNLKPTIHSYYGLLVSTSLRASNVEPLLTMLQTMEENNIIPTSICYSILFDKMVECNDFDGYNDIIEHITKNLNPPIYPNLLVLRKLIIAFTNNRNEELVRETLQLYIHAKGLSKYIHNIPLNDINFTFPELQIPVYLQDRIMNITKEMNLSDHILKGNGEMIQPIIEMNRVYTLTTFVRYPKKK